MYRSLSDVRLHVIRISTVLMIDFSSLSIFSTVERWLYRTGIGNIYDLFLVPRILIVAVCSVFVTLLPVAVIVECQNDCVGVTAKVNQAVVACFNVLAQHQLVKPRETLIRLVDVPAEIRKGYLLNTDLNGYRYTILFYNVFYSID